MADSPAANGIDSLKSNAAAAYNSVTNGPVAQNVKDQHAKTTAEFANLAASRHIPANPAATGQPLTHYHSFFTELLSWRNPRASAIAYVSIVSSIFLVRYLDVLRWGFKLTWMVLGITVAAEVAGKTLLNSGLASQLRPRQYYTVPRATLDALLGDVHELINFFVIESQRILFAENVWASIAVALCSFISYYLVKIVPYWGLALLGTTLAFVVPLVYTSNQELIDHHLKQANDVVNAQTEQLRSVAQKHTEQYAQLTKEYLGDYTAKAQAMIRGARGGDSVPVVPTKTPLKDADFPAAPKEDIKAAGEPEPSKAEEEPLIAA
ncbi:hypothetical protein GQ53DRAFT_829434 [Thozetella sp. PMI_491]|nr:hypothetical protein GQ53DRAFT_829434 [Thozetella sp. PMI_491]